MLSGLFAFSIMAQLCQVEGDFAIIFGKTLTYKPGDPNGYWLCFPFPSMPV